MAKLKENTDSHFLTGWGGSGSYILFAVTFKVITQNKFRCSEISRTAPINSAEDQFRSRL